MVRVYRHPVLILRYMMLILVESPLILDSEGLLQWQAIFPVIDQIVLE